MSVRALSIVLAWGCAVPGCTSFHPVETTPEAIIETVRPGDAVRLTRTDGRELTLLVLAVSDQDIRGRTRERSAEPVSVRFDRIRTLELERLELKRVVLRVVVPVLIGAAIVCAHQDCVTHAAVISSPSN